MFQTTLLYTGILGLFFLIQSLNIIRLRRGHRVGIYSGGNKDLALAIRSHANFSEYVPIITILMALLESHGIDIFWIHLIGTSLLLGRILHFWGLIHSEGTSVGRFVGMVLTFLPLLFASITAIAYFIL